MPLAWACVIVELGYPAIRLYGLLKGRLADRAAAIVATITVSVAAAITIGFYEYFAYQANWWRYESANAMLGDFCALYIPLGEFIMFLFVLPIAARAFARDDRPMATAIEGGARFALAIAVGYVLGYLILEAGRMP